MCHIRIDQATCTVDHLIEQSVLIWFHAVAGESTVRVAPFHHTFGVFAFCKYRSNWKQNEKHNLKSLVVKIVKVMICGIQADQNENRWEFYKHTLHISCLNKLIINEKDIQNHIKIHTLNIFKMDIQILL